MKAKKTIAAIAVCAVLAASAIGFAACSEDTDVTTSPLHLDVPENVTIVDGGDNYTNDDDYVTFNAVENAASYQLFVWSGSEAATETTQAMVVSSTTTTIYMPSDLTAGTYYLGVRAVGDQINYDFSNLSETKTYACKTTEQATGVVLGTVSNIAMSFDNIDADEAIYPTITFDAVDGAARYSAYIYSATVDEDNNYTKSGDSVTNFNIPANSSTTTNGKVSYMIGETNYEDLDPGYFVIEVYTRGDDEYYLDSTDCATGTALWGNQEFATPVISVSGNSVTITNNTDFASGTQFTVIAYSDEECTTAVETRTVTYTLQKAAMPWESDTASFSNNTFSELTEGETYYFTAQAVYDGVIYTVAGVSDVVSAVAGAASSS